MSDETTPRPAPTTAARADGRPSLLDAALKGALAGTLGGIAMTLATKVEEKALLPRGEQAAATPDKVVERLADDKGAELSGAETVAAAAGLQLGYCALWGALYGMVQSRLHPPALLHGPVLGGLAYAAGFSGGGLLPRLGVVPPPTQQSLEQAAIPVGSHLAFGITTAAAFEALGG